jgi:hypothetical protein
MKMHDRVLELTEIVDHVEESPEILVDALDGGGVDLHVAREDRPRDLLVEFVPRADVEEGLGVALGHLRVVARRVRSPFWRAKRFSRRSSQPAS